MARLITYLRANHIAMLAIFLALAGGAYAAAGFDSGDVKNKTLKGKDLKPKTLKGKQVADGSLGGAAVDESTLDVTRIVARLRDTTNRTVPRGGTFNQLAPIGTWTQRADELNEVFGSATVDFPAGCVQPRIVQLFMTRPGSNFPTSFDGFVASGLTIDTGVGAATAAAPISSSSLLVPGANDAAQFEPGVDTPRSLDVFGVGQCAAGSTADPVITDLDLDIVGHR
jgi:hypothetical protein